MIIFAVAPVSASKRPTAAFRRPCGLQSRATRLLQGSERRAEIENYAAVDLARLHSVEDIVDLRERHLGDFRTHLAFGSEGNGFIEIAARTDDRTTHRN